MAFDYDRYGNAFLAMRLHRLRSKVTEQCDVMFAENGLRIPTACVSVMLFLAETNRTSIATIAKETGYSHQLVTQRLAQLEALKMVERFENVADRRKWNIRLTRRGHTEAAKILEFLDHATAAFSNLFDELGADLDHLLTEADRLLDVRPLGERIA